jgi:hypothetical protein
LVALIRKQEGPDKLLDVGLSSLRGGAWGLRSKPGTADGSPIVAIAPKDRIPVGSPRHHHAIRCAAARAPVVYPL